MLNRVGIPAPRAPRRRLPAPAVGRHAPARHDRDGTHQLAGAADRRRADDRPRRHGPGPDPGPDRAAPDRVRHRGHHDHPRPRDRGRRRRRRRRHVRRPGRRGRPDRRSCTPSPRCPTRWGSWPRSRAWTARPTGSTRSRATRRRRSGIPKGCVFHPRCKYTDRVPDRACFDGPAGAPRERARTTSSAATSRRGAPQDRDERPRIAARAAARHSPWRCGSGRRARGRSRMTEMVQEVPRGPRGGAGRAVGQEILRVTDLKKHFPIKSRARAAAAHRRPGQGRRRDQPEPRTPARRSASWARAAAASRPPAGRSCGCLLRHRRQDRRRRQGHHEPVAREADPVPAEGPDHLPGPLQRPEPAAHGRHDHQRAVPGPEGQAARAASRTPSTS